MRMAEGAAGSYRSLTQNYHLESIILSSWNPYLGWREDLSPMRSSTVRDRRDLAAVSKEKESRENLRRTSGHSLASMAVGFVRGPRDGMPGSAAGTTLSFNGPQRNRKEPRRLALEKQVRATLWRQRWVFSWEHQHRKGWKAVIWGAWVWWKGKTLRRRECQPSIRAGWLTGRWNRKSPGKEPRDSRGESASPCWGWVPAWVMKRVKYLPQKLACPEDWKRALFPTVWIWGQSIQAETPHG